MIERNPYAPPQAAIRDAQAAPPSERTLATRTRRLAGAMVDGVAWAVLVLPILVFPSDWTAATFGELSYGNRAVISLGAFALFVAMQGFPLARGGQTVGKWLVGTRIVRADNGEVPTLARTLSLRYGTLALGLPQTLLAFSLLDGVIPYVFVAFGLIDSALIFGRDQRCLHDLIARTKVVAVARS